MKLDPPRLLAITPEDAARQPLKAQTWFDGLLSGALRSALPMDQILVQIRDKHASEEQLAALYAALLEQARDVGIRWSMNSHLDLARKLNFKAVHLTSEQSAALVSGQSAELAPNPEEDSWGIMLGVSTHSPTELRNLPSGYTYAVCGPVFDTPSKRRFGSPMGLQRFSEVCRAAAKRALPVLGIGGIDASNVEPTVTAGAFGVAAIRSLQDPHQTRQICDSLQRYLESGAKTESRPAKPHAGEF